MSDAPESRHLRWLREGQEIPSGYRTARVLDYRRTRIVDGVDEYLCELTPAEEVGLLGCSAVKFSEDCPGGFSTCERPAGHRDLHVASYVPIGSEQAIATVSWRVRNGVIEGIERHYPEPPAEPDPDLAMTPEPRPCGPEAATAPAVAPSEEERVRAGAYIPVEEPVPGRERIPAVRPGDSLTWTERWVIGDALAAYFEHMTGQNARANLDAIATKLGIYFLSNDDGTGLAMVGLGPQALYAPETVEPRP